MPPSPVYLLKQVPTTFEFVDVAGLVKGASNGEGLGNQFLGNIRTTDAIVQVRGCFWETTHCARAVWQLFLY